MRSVRRVGEAGTHPTSTDHVSGPIQTASNGETVGKNQVNSLYDGGDRGEARANDDQAGIEQARTARVRLGPHRTARSDNPKLKQRGRNDATSNGKRCWKRISKP